MTMPEKGTSELAELARLRWREMAALNVGRIEQAARYLADCCGAQAAHRQWQPLTWRRVDDS